MANSLNIISNLLNVNVSNNEAITTHSINRNIEKLLENDLALNDIYSSIFGKSSIQEYIKGNEYNFNDLVWFLDDNKDLYILRCLVDGNTEYPMMPFEKYNWHNENEYVDLIKTSLDVLINRYIQKKYDEHANNQVYHKYGILNVDNIDSKILLQDFSNVDKNRKNYFFPNKTISMLDVQPELSNVILNGYCRVWDCGLLEYDIVYRFGYAGTEMYNGLEYTTLTCNNVKFDETTIDKTDVNLEYQTNSDYFNSSDDFGIFKYDNMDVDNYSVIGNTIQRNRNDAVNTYFAKIPFLTDYVFKDNNYMIFNSSMTNEYRDSDTGQLDPGANAITYCNKTRSSITAILITFPTDHVYKEKGYNATNGGIAINTYHCKIVGELSR